MGEGPVVAIIRGLKVHIRVLDEFFYNNGCHPTSGYPPFYEKDPDEWTTLLRSKLSGNKMNTRLFIPARKDHDNSKFGYIAWTYEMVYAQKEVRLPQDLPVDPPEGWDSLKDEILSFSTSKDDVISEKSGHGKMGVFIIVCEGRNYTPPSIDQRGSHCDQCDQCDAVLDHYFDRQRHRSTEHGLEEVNPLPDDE